MDHSEERLHALDAVRASALLLGIVLHGTMSFMPALASLGWPIVDASPSGSLQFTFFVIHLFRMTAFFVIAGFFAHLLCQRRGVSGFIKDRSKRVLLPLAVGWIVITPIVIAIFVWAATSKTGTPMTPPPRPDGAFAVPLMHLWFLYVLALFYLAMLSVRQLALKFMDGNALRARADAIVEWLMRSRLAPLILALPVAATLALRPRWNAFEGIPTPDQSLIPTLPAFVGYGVAFTFGWLLHRQQALLSVLKRSWLAYAVAAILITTSVMILGADVRIPIAASAVAYAVGSWVCTFALIGMTMRLLSAHRPWIRYLADASYWLYLAHLPLVFALQTWMAEWPLHWSIKFPLLMVIATVLLLASYHYLVRNTIIGETLNGRRYATRRVGEAPPSAAPPSATHAGPLARLCNVKKSYGATMALDGLDLEIGRGELLALLGPNGAGKSTAIALLLGLERPDSGDISLFGESPDSLAARRQTGIMMQEVTLPAELRVRELLDLTASYYAAPMTPEAAMAMTQTSALAERPYGKLSGGQKRQVQFAMAICGRPQLLFLDEPTVGLDIKARERMWRTIRELLRGGCSMVLTTHYLEEAEALADQVVVVAKGKVISSGSVNDMRSLVSRRRIECATATPIGTIEQWPEVEAAVRSGDRIQITTAQAEIVVRRLLEHDASLSELEVRRAGLSEAFTELTQEAA